MQGLIKTAREKAGLTQETVARSVHMSTSNYRRYETGELPLSTEIVAKLSRILGCPTLTMVWCRSGCDIGRLYCYDILNNVNLNPTAILSKYRQEEREAHEALDLMLNIVINKIRAEDCTEMEMHDLWHCALEMLDLEHVIQTLKLRLWDFCNVADLVAAHNRKCVEKRYVDTKKPALQLAG